MSSIKNQETPSVQQEVLIVDSELSSNLDNIINVKEYSAVQKDFLESYLKNKDDMELQSWLSMELQKKLPEKTPEDIATISEEILTTLTINKKKLEELKSAIKSGRSKEDWFAVEVQKTVANMETSDAIKMVKELKGVAEESNISVSNEYLLDTIEEYHVDTFNANAEENDSPYRAKFISFTKNVEDKKKPSEIVIFDDKDNIVKKYFVGNYSDSDEAINLQEDTDKFVDEQVKYLKEAVIRAGKLEAPDGTVSKPLSKKALQKITDEARSGNWDTNNWNKYQVKDLAIGIGNNVCQAGAMGAVHGAKTMVINKVLIGERIDGGEVLETALISGTHEGVKVAISGALKVGVEKGLVPALARNTSIVAITNIAGMAVENVDVLIKIKNKEITIKEAIEIIEQNTVSGVASAMATAKGAAIGATFGAFLGPVGAILGGAIGGTIAGMAGSKIAKTVVKGAQKLREIAGETLSSACRGAVRITSSIGSVCSGIVSFLSS